MKKKKEGFEMAWEYERSYEIICPNHGTIARVDIYMDDWLQVRKRVGLWPREC